MKRFLLLFILTAANLSYSQVELLKTDVETSSIPIILIDSMAPASQDSLSAIFILKSSRVQHNVYTTYGDYGTATLQLVSDTITGMRETLHIVQPSDMDGVETLEMHYYQQDDVHARLGFYSTRTLSCTLFSHSEESKTLHVKLHEWNGRGGGSRVTLEFYWMITTPGQDLNQSILRSNELKSLNDLQGDWTCYKTGCQKMCEVCCENERYIDFRVEGDTTYFFHYPNTFIGSCQLQLGDPWPSCHDVDSPTNFSYRFEKLRLNDDSLSIMDYYFFKKEKFDDEVVETLIRDTIYPPHLIGDWSLVIRYDNGYDGDEQSDGYRYVDFPFKVPSKLTWNTSSMYSRQGRFIELKVAGVIRRFEIIGLSDYRIKLKPTGWYDKRFQFEYERIHP